MSVLSDVALTSASGIPVLSMDANFGLVKKHSSGESSISSAHGNRLFLDDKLVRGFLASCDDGKVKSSVEVFILYRQYHFFGSPPCIS